jgi:hypothetical protein
MKQVYKLFLTHKADLHGLALHVAVFGLTAFVVAMYAPCTGEILNGMLIQIGTIINITLAILAAVVVVALALYNFGKGVSVRFVAIVPEDTGRMLGPGKWSAPDISPDRLICLLPGESVADFAARADRAIGEADPARWTVVLPFRQPVGLIYSGGGDHKDFTRDAPPFINDGQVVPAEYKFTQEGEREYQQYLQWFAEHFREWAAGVKITQDTNPGAIFRKVLKASVAVFALLFAVPAFAQSSSEQVANVLAAAGRTNEVPVVGSEVEYEFQRKTYMRRGDGRRTYVALLTSIQNYRDNAAGSFVRLVVDGEQIAKQTRQVRQASTSAIPVEETDMPIDSAGLADRLEDARNQFDFYKSQFWQSVRPTWETVMYIFWGLLPILGILGVVLWFWAKLSASEEMPDIHWRSSRALVLLVGLTWTVLIINFTMTLISWEPGPVGLAIGVGVIAWAAFRSASILVPNIQAKPGGRTAFLPGNYNNRQLPG